MCMHMYAIMSYARSTNSHPQVGRSSADSLHVARQGNAVGQWSADHRATVGRMDNIVVGEGNQWGMFLMWQLQSADQNRVCRPINIKKSSRPTVGFNVTQALVFPQTYNGKNENWLKLLSYCRYFDRIFLELLSSPPLSIKLCSFWFVAIATERLKCWINPSHAAIRITVNATAAGYIYKKKIPSLEQVKKILKNKIGGNKIGDIQQIYTSVPL